MTALAKKRVKSTLFFIFKLALGLIFVAPIIVCVLFSLQPEGDIGTLTPKLFTAHPTLENYATVMNTMPIFKYLKNSLVVCMATIVLQVFLVSFAAYAFSFFQFKGKNLLFTLVLVAMMIPPDIVVITNYVTIQKLHLTDTYLGLMFPSLISGMGIFLMRQYFLTVPKDLMDAAVIDGCGKFRFLFQILLPMSLPTIASLSLYTFIIEYNHYFWPLLVTNTDAMRTIQIGISMLVRSDWLEYGPMLAGAAAAIIPPILIFIFGQDYIVKGMTDGAVKG